jgi:D-alanyl-D-alanine carboxypeptidase
MVGSTPRLLRGSSLVAVGLIASVAALAISTDTADARRHRGKASISHRAKASHYSPPYSAIVVDANTGKSLHEASPDAPRHPASLTKIMTLYLLFERLEAGKLKLNSPLEVSSHAASMAPSKLDLKPGETIRVEDAIRAVVTKSANDVAVVIAENVGGDEPTFARMMTKKARLLGMKQTLYRNASGLPNDEQITSARDQATLGRAIQDRFPKYYAYFSTHTFTYKGNAMRNHNKLLGSVEGVDGIKTGYVTASGFNLVTSVKRNGRHLVAVVMGGRSGNSRDARMRELISGNISLAAAKRTAPPILEASENSTPTVVASAVDTQPLPRTQEPAAVAMPDVAGGGGAAYAPPAVVAQIPQGDALAGSTDDLRPIAVKTVRAKASSLASTPINSARKDTEESIATVSSAGTLGAPSAGGGSTGGTATAPVQAARPAPAPQAGPIVTAMAAPIQATPVSLTSAGDSPQHGWMIQVGALETQKDADERIADARSKAKNFLAKAKAFTESIVKSDMKLYRARFANISREDAEAACKTLKTVKIVCIALKN